MVLETILAASISSWIMANWFNGVKRKIERSKGEATFKSEMSPCPSAATEDDLSWDPLCDNEDHVLRSGVPKEISIDWHLYTTSTESEPECAFSFCNEADSNPKESNHQGFELNIEM